MKVINKIYKSIETEMNEGLKRMSISTTLHRDLALDTEEWNILPETSVKQELKSLELRSRK